MRSNIPPWPGKILPKSFIAKCLLIALKAKSPICPIIGKVILATIDNPIGKPLIKINENDKQTITHILENSDIMDKFYKRKNEKEEDVRIFYIQIEHGELSDFERDMRIEF